MEVLETYEEMIESNPKDISICWKILQISFYLLSVISGYGAAILFYILWYENFAGNCPFWAEITSPIYPRQMPEDIPLEEEIAPVMMLDWRHKIIVIYNYATRCKLYHFVSLGSCVFGIAWMTLFAMCGRGGYDTRIFVAPWTVVPPAIIFQFIFAILVIFVVHDVEYGYSKFVNSLYRVTAGMNETQLATLKRPCDVLQSYLTIFGPTKYNVCQLYPALRILSWIMAWSWVLGLTTLIFRVVSVNDFKLLTVRIYRISKDEIDKYSHKRPSSESSESVSMTDEEATNYIDFYFTLKTRFSARLAGAGTKRSVI